MAIYQNMSGHISKLGKYWLQKWEKRDKTTHKHVKYDNFENFIKSIKSLTLGSRDSFTSNFTIFQKKKIQIG